MIDHRRSHSLAQRLPFIVFAPHSLVWDGTPHLDYLLDYFVDGVELPGSGACGDGFDLRTSHCAPLRNPFDTERGVQRVFWREIQQCSWPARGEQSRWAMRAKGWSFPKARRCSVAPDRTLRVPRRREVLGRRGEPKRSGQLPTPEERPSRAVAPSQLAPCAK